MGGKTAVNQNRRSVQIVGERPAKKYDNVGNIAGGTQPADRNLAHNTAAALMGCRAIVAGAGGNGSVARGPDGGGANGTR